MIQCGFVLLAILETSDQTCCELSMDGGIKVPMDEIPQNVTLSPHS